MTQAEVIARTLGRARGTGQTTMLAETAKASPHRAVVVTWTAKEADHIAREHAVEARSAQDERSFIGRRGEVYLVDNHVMQKLGDEHHNMQEIIALKQRGIEALEKTLAVTFQVLDASHAISGSLARDLGEFKRAALRRAVGHVARVAMRRRS